MAVLLNVVRATVVVKPFIGDTVTVEVPVPPVQNGTVVMLAAKLKSTTVIGSVNVCESVLTMAAHVGTSVWTA